MKKHIKYFNFKTVSAPNFRSIKILSSHMIFEIVAALYAFVEDCLPLIDTPQLYSPEIQLLGIAALLRALLLDYGFFFFFALERASQPLLLLVKCLGVDYGGTIAFEELFEVCFVPAKHALQPAVTRLRQLI